MIRSLFGSTTDVAMLRGGLEETSATQKGIAARVARATSASANGDFAGELAAAAGKAGKAGRLSDVDLQQEMAAMADTQLRYEANAKLLQQAYGRIRTALRDRA